MNAVVSEEERLIQSYDLGDTRAFEKLLDRHKNYIFNCINAKIRDVAVTNDILQETFIKIFLALHHSHQYKESGKFKAWVVRIANNLVMDYFRKKENHPSYKKELNTDIKYNHFDEAFEIEVDLSHEKNILKLNF